ncbi:MAG: DUF445 family protein [Fusobacterium sp. JB021]|nr:DUF445 family protein [Fusobacterium sp. JB020]MDP0493021.1 DUF445 family protein [Fusobacterium sp. JB021]MDP0506419.1 DUF445 family protein [Fusobacterium sp. JB019]
MNQDLVLKGIILIIVGSLIGWTTNYIAIKMLFRPYKEINLGLFKIQGLLPKRKHEIGQGIAEVVEKELLSLEDITSKISSEDIEEKIGELIDKVLKDKLKEEILSLFPMAALFLNDSILEKIKGAIKNSILGNKDEMIKVFINYLQESVDIKEIVIEKVDAFSLEKIEKIICDLAKKELKHIEIIGAILGAIIGAVQFMLISFM